MEYEDVITCTRIRSLDGLSVERALVPIIASTGGVKRDGFIVDQTGWEVENFQRNPIILWNHGNDRMGSMPIARAENVQIGADLRMDTIFDMEDPESARIFGKVQRGFVNAVSARWRPIKAEQRRATMDGKQIDVVAFTRQELLEVSYTGLPVDPDSEVIRSVAGGVIDLNALFTPAQAASYTDQIESIAKVIRSEGGSLDSSALVAAHGLYRTLRDLLSETINAEEEEDRKRRETLSLVERSVAALSTPIDVEGIIVRTLAKKTGQSEDSIRERITA